MQALFGRGLVVTVEELDRRGFRAWKEPLRLVLILILGLVLQLALTPQMLFVVVIVVWSFW